MGVSEALTVLLQHYACEVVARDKNPERLQQTGTSLSAETKDHLAMEYINRHKTISRVNKAALAAILGEHKTLKDVLSSLGFGAHWKIQNSNPKLDSVRKVVHHIVRDASKDGYYKRLEKRCLREVQAENEAGNYKTEARKMLRFCKAPKDRRLLEQGKIPEHKVAYKARLHVAEALICACLLYMYGDQGDSMEKYLFPYFTEGEQQTRQGHRFVQTFAGEVISSKKPMTAAL